MKKAFDKYSYYRFAISNTTIEVSSQKGILQQKAHTGKEMRSNSLYRFWNDQNH